MKPGTNKVALLLAFSVLFQFQAISQSASGVVNTYYAITTVSTATTKANANGRTGNQKQLELLMNDDNWLKFSVL